MICNADVPFLGSALERDDPCSEINKQIIQTLGHVFWCVSKFFVLYLVCSEKESKNVRNTDFLFPCYHVLLLKYWYTFPFDVQLGETGHHNGGKFECFRKTVQFGEAHHD